MYKPGDRELLLCECESPEHSVLVFFEEDENYPILYFEVHLKKLPWYYRILYAIKYVFGHQSKYGSFDTFIFKYKDAEKLEKITEYLKKKVSF